MIRRYVSIGIDGRPVRVERTPERLEKPGIVEQVVHLGQPGRQAQAASGKIPSHNVGSAPMVRQHDGPDPFSHKGFGPS